MSGVKTLVQAAFESAVPGLSPGISGINASVLRCYFQANFVDCVPLFAIECVSVLIVAGLKIDLLRETSKDVPSSAWPKGC